MNANLVTNSDLKRVAIRDDVLGVRLEITLLQMDLNTRFLLLRRDLDDLRDVLRKDIEASRDQTIIWLGSIQVVVSGLLFAALRLTA